MSKKSKLAEIESVIPVSAIEALRNNLLYATLNAVSGDDMDEIVKAQAKKAKGGDSKAAKMLMDMSLSSLASVSSGTRMNVRSSAIFMEGNKADWRIETRKVIACMIAFAGPHTTETIANRLSLSGEQVMDALMCDWFTRDGGKWHITNAARSSVIDAPYKITRQIANTGDDWREGDEPEPKPE